MLLQLLTCEKMLSLPKEKGIDVHVAETKEAAEIYNDLVSKGVAVGELFHSTC